MIGFWALVVAGALSLCPPVVIAGLGEIFLERAGGFNVGIEGMMLVGAVTGVVAAVALGPWVGLLAGLVAGGLLGALLGGATAIAGANFIIVGIALGLFGSGLSSYLFQWLSPAGRSNATAAILPTLDLPFLAGIPLLGPGVAHAGVLLYLAVALSALSWWVLSHTRFGLRLRVVGEDEYVAVTRGLSPRRYRFTAAVLAGAAAGLAGAGVPLAGIGSFTPNMTGGVGFIALAVVIIARRDPRGVLAAAVLFSLFDSLALLAQTQDLGLPVELYQAFPYAVALAVLCLVTRHLRRRDGRVRTSIAPGGASRTASP